MRSVKEIADRLSRRGMDVTIIAPSNTIRGGENFDFKIKWMNMPHITGPTFYSLTKAALRQVNPDAVFVMGGNLFKPYMIEAAKSYPSMVRLYAYELRCPASYGLLFRDGHVCNYNFLKTPHKCITCTEDIRRMWHNPSIIERPESIKSLKLLYPIYQMLVRRSIGKISVAVATTEYMKKQFEGVIPLDQISIIADGVDSEFFHPWDRHEGRKIKIITLPGRAFDPIKGLEVLLKAGGLLWKKRQDFRLVITGSGKKDISLDYPFVGGDIWLDDKDIPGMYGNSDIIVVPSIWGEPFGLTALEGMSSEIAVVASRIGGLQEIVKDGETGLLFQPGSYTELASILDRLLDDSDLRARLGRNGRKHVIENYSWDRIIDQYEVLIQDMVKRKRN